MIEIEGEHHGAPAHVKVDGDRVTWTYSIKPLHRAGGVARLDQLTISLAPARRRGLQPAHAILLLGGIGMVFAKLEAIGAAIAAGAFVNTIYRLIWPPHVLVLASDNTRFELVVARRSLAAARTFATAHAAR